MIKGSANLCSAFVLLAITFVVASDTNNLYEIGEINNKVMHLQGRLDIFYNITDGNESKCAENVTNQINEANRKFNNLVNKVDSLAKYVGKLNTLVAKLDALATSVTNLAGDNKEILLKPPSSQAEPFACPLVNQNSGVYNIQLNSNSPPFDVYCMADPKGGLPWTVVQRRVDGSVDFYRNWTEYQKGFGDLETNFFIGLDNLHSLTTTGGPQELWVMLIDRDGLDAHAYYDAFAIGNEAEKYALNVLGAYSGDAGDSLTFQKLAQFSTYDKDNHLKNANCAEHFKSAWWFHDCHFHHCHHSQLNGEYGSIKQFGGLNWQTMDKYSHISRKYAHMAIRPARK